jgi:uncharacterized repeat protein (TIGR01451 family)
VRTTAVFALIGVFLGGLAVACGDGGGEPTAMLSSPTPTPQEPTTVSLNKTTVEMGEGEFRFTLELSNTGDNAAVNVTTADVWQEGLEVTDIGSVEGQQPQRISDLGLQFTLRELEAGKTVRLDYTARCRQSGDWENTAVAGAANSEPVQAVATVACP